jgi:hypothetical protein
MKRLLLILILTFSFQTLVKADDIRDFQIEGISIGDSALDFMLIDEIKKTIKLTANNYSYLKNPKKYREAYIFESNNFKNYEKVSLMFKQNDKNYKILFVRGLIDYNENLTGCLSKLSEIARDVENSIPNHTKDTFEFKSPLDKSGNSIYHFTIYTLVSGDDIRLSCNDWDEKLRKKKNWSEGLSVALHSKEIGLWLSNHK